MYILSVISKLNVTLFIYSRDKKDISLLSSVHNVEKISIDKKDTEEVVIIKLKLIVDYRYTIGGIGEKFNIYMTFKVLKREVKRSL